MSASVVKPSLRASRSQAARIARLRPRRVQSLRTNIAQAPAVRGSSSRKPLPDEGAAYTPRACVNEWRVSDGT